MDFEKLVIILMVFGIVVVLFPTIVSEIAGIDSGSPLKWLFDFVPFAFFGGFIFAVAIWGLSKE